MTDVKLRHVTFTTSGKVYLPDGPAVHSDHGVVTIPLSRPLAILSAWYDGYRIDDDTDEEIRSVEAFIEAMQEHDSLPKVHGTPVDNVDDEETEEDVVVPTSNEVEDDDDTEDDQED